MGDQPLGDERMGHRLGHVVDGLDAVRDDRGDRGGPRVADPARVGVGEDRVGAWPACRVTAGRRRATGTAGRPRRRHGAGGPRRASAAPYGSSARLRDPAGDAEVRQQQLDAPDELRRVRHEGDLRPGPAAGEPDRGVGREEALEVGDLEIVGDPVDLGRDVLADSRRGGSQAVAILEHPDERARLGEYSQRATGSGRRRCARRPVETAVERAVVGGGRAAAEPALEVLDGVLAVARLGQQPVELLGQRLGGRLLGRPEGERRNVTAEHAVGAHPAEDLPAPDVLLGRIEADRVARLTDLDPIDLGGQLVDPLPVAVVGQEAVVAGRPDRAAVLERHPVDLAVADEGDQRGRGGRPSGAGRSRSGCRS